MNWFDPAAWQESGGLYGLIVMGLFVLIFVDRAMVSRQNERITKDLIKTLYERGHLPDRRRRDWGIAKQRRETDPGYGQPKKADKWEGEEE